MSSPLTFQALSERVLAGEVAVETVPGVPAWPSKAPRPGRAKGGSAFLFLHRDHPGVVAVVAFLSERPVITGCFSDRLCLFLAEHHSDEFNFELQRDPWDALRFVVNAAGDAVWTGGDLDAAFRQVCGVDGADLLRELRRVHPPGAALH